MDSAPAVGPTAPPAQRPRASGRLWLIIGGVLLLCVLLVLYQANTPAGRAASATALAGSTVTAVAGAQATATVIQAGAITVWPPATGTAQPAATVPAGSGPARMDLRGTVNPRTLRIGDKLVVDLDIVNIGDTTIPGVRIESTGPWDKYVITGVQPNGSFSAGFLGVTEFVISDEISAGAHVRMSIIAFPKEAGNHTFQFSPSTAQGERVDGRDGRPIYVGGSVAVLP